MTAPLGAAANDENSVAPNGSYRRWAENPMHQVNLNRAGTDTPRAPQWRHSGTNLREDHRMTENMHHEKPMKLKEYAEHIGVHPRTVRTWLDDGELPSAYKDDFSGDWFFPAGTTRHQLPADVRKANRLRNELTKAAAAAGHDVGNGLVVSPANREVAVVDDEPEDDDLDDDDRPMSDRLDLANIFLTVAEAARLLGVPRAQIHAHPEFFEAKPVGYNGSLMIPKYVLRRFEGK